MPRAKFLVPATTGANVYDSESAREIDGEDSALDGKTEWESALRSREKPSEVLDKTRVSEGFS